MPFSCASLCSFHTILEVTSIAVPGVYNQSKGEPQSCLAEHNRCPHLFLRVSVTSSVIARSLVSVSRCCPITHYEVSYITRLGRILEFKTIRWPQNEVSCSHGLQDFFDQAHELAGLARRGAFAISRLEKGMHSGV